MKNSAMHVLVLLLMPLCSPVKPKTCLGWELRSTITEIRKVSPIQQNFQSHTIGAQFKIVGTSGWVMVIKWDAYLQVM